MRFSALLFTITLLISSCGGSNEEKAVLIEEPDDLIPRDKMVLLIADVHLLEACLQYRIPHTTSRVPNIMGPGQPEAMQEAVVTTLPTDQKAMPYYDIFKKYGYTHDQYDRSLRWYMTDAELYGEMYDEVINELIRRQAYEQGGVAPPADSTK